MTTLSLQQAADAAGVSKSTIFRAVKSGRLSANRDADGNFQIAPSELFRVYEAKSEEPKRRASPALDATDADTELRIRNAQLESQIKALQEIVELEREQRKAWQTQAERLALAPPKPELPAVIPLPGPAPESAPPPKRSWWSFRRAS